MASALHQAVLSRGMGAAAAAAWCCCYQACCAVWM